MSADQELGGFATEEFLSGGVAPVLAAREQAFVTRIAAEATYAFERMAAVRRGVTIFGSAREAAASRWGDLTREVAAALAKQGFTVITGGGPGVMAAANEGAFAQGGASVGLTIELPLDEQPNEFLTLQIPFHYFFLRKLTFVKYSCAFILMPGGYGTLDELFEALNLRRTHRLDPFPVILVGTAYWRGLLDWMQDQGVADGTLTSEDLASVTLIDDPAEVVRMVADCHRTLCHRLGLAP